MGHSVTLGGDRLGSGNKQKVELHGFERSTHDLGYTWRNTQAPGTLVPFMVQLALPGDTFDIDLQADVKTHPTIGPLFASFKLQLDVFECPIRLYHGWLHNNKLNIGNDMSKVKLPQVSFNVNPLIFGNSEDIDRNIPPLEFQQINQSCLLAYLGIRGVGQGTYGNVKLTKNGVPLLAYWDIYKNYYANKQEEIGVCIHNYEPIDLVSGVIVERIDTPNELLHSGESFKMNVPITGSEQYRISFAYYGETAITEIKCLVTEPDNLGIWYNIPITVTSTDQTTHFEVEGILEVNANRILWGFQTPDYYDDDLTSVINSIRLQTFPLENIDKMREDILLHDNLTPFTFSDSWEPYSFPFFKLRNAYSLNHNTSICSQEGLGIKTYQSDIFNNWLNTEWIDGTGGINEITSVSTAGGSFEINTLNLAQKVYDMLNRIAVSGGTYEDWLKAVYDHEAFRRCETPMYYGGLSKEIIFQEVIGMAGTQTDNLGEGENQYTYHPLGTLAGRGILSNKHKGGKITIKCNEPSYIIGIVSITPRIDYYQGNEFFTTHLTMNDLHKPSLDEIGFQSLVTDKMAFWDTTINNELPTYKEAGKQPAWLDYMTNYNKVYGNFADTRSEMFMTLTRRYEPDIENKTITDLTTYIDPTKFNYAFAENDLTAMNFWVQIGVDMIARRKMSAKLMPNL